MKNYILKDEGIKFINHLLNIRLRDFYSYNKIVKKLLNIKTNIPIYIDSNIIFLPIKSYKAYDCIWLNYKEIKSVVDKNKTCIIKFNDGEIKEFEVSYNKLKRIIKNAKILINYFVKIECENVNT